MVVKTLVLVKRHWRFGKQEVISEHHILFMVLAFGLPDRVGGRQIGSSWRMRLTPDQKLCGLLAPLFALRTEKDLGIGDTESLTELVGWASEHGFGLVQVLPINETGGDNSPYNSISSLALDPTTIATNPKALKDLSAEDYEKICGRHDLPALRKGKVNYRGVRALKGDLLETAWKNFKTKQIKEKTRRAKEFAVWGKGNAVWLEPYTLFRALVRWHGENENTDLWPKKQRTYAAARKWLASASPADKRKVRALRDFFSYVQWVAYRQWSELKTYGDTQNVALVGDVPVGVSIFSADVFAQPEIFDLTRSAGAPPEKVLAADPFTAKWGQNWGFPLYNWEEMAKDDYAWWRQRLCTTMEIFHFLRVDHALGFFRIYSFPWRPERNEEFLPLSEDEAKARTGGVLPGFVPGDDSSGESRETNRAQGDRLFRMIVEETGQHRLIAEDLGEMSPYVRPVLQAQEIPGFKIPLWEIARMAGRCRGANTNVFLSSLMPRMTIRRCMLIGTAGMRTLNRATTNGRAGRCGRCKRSAVLPR